MYQDKTDTAPPSSYLVDLNALACLHSQDKTNLAAKSEDQAHITVWLRTTMIGTKNSSLLSLRASVCMQDTQTLLGGKMACLTY